MATYSYPWQPESTRTLVEVSNEDYYSILSSLDALARKINGMSMTMMRAHNTYCDLCGGGHRTIDCQIGNPFQQPEENYYMDDFPRQHSNFYSNTYNPGWSNHSNFYWEVPQPPQGFVSQEEEPNLEELLTNFIIATEAKFQSQEASIKNLEIQVGQLVETLSSSISETLSIDMEPNPEDVMEISLNSGNKFGEKAEEEILEEDKTLGPLIKVEIQMPLKERSGKINMEDGTPTIKIDGVLENPNVPQVMKIPLVTNPKFSINLFDFIVQVDFKVQRKNDLWLALGKALMAELALKVEPPHGHFKCALLEPFEEIPYELKPD